MSTSINPITGPQVWQGETMSGRSDWVYRLPADSLDNLQSIVKSVSARGVTAKDFNFERVNIQDLRVALMPIVNALGDGAGVALIKDMNIQNYTIDELKMALLLIGHHIGFVGPQEGINKWIGEVRDVNPVDRSHYYHGGGPLPMHMDPVDVAGLLCIRDAKLGGTSHIVSSSQVHNEILNERPDLLEILYRGYRQRRREHRRKGGPPLTEFYCPVFAEVGGKVVCNYLPRPILVTLEEGLVDLTNDEKEALTLLDKTAARDDLRLEMDFEPLVCIFNGITDF